MKEVPIPDLSSGMNVYGNMFDWYQELWDKTEPARESPLRPGTHIHKCDVEDLVLRHTRYNECPYILLKFIVIERAVGKTLSRFLWLTEKGMPYAKRDLLKLGLDTNEKIKQSFKSPPRKRCFVFVEPDQDTSRRKNENVRGFVLLGPDELA